MKETPNAAGNTADQITYDQAISPDGESFKSWVTVSNFLDLSTDLFHILLLYNPTNASIYILFMFTSACVIGKSQNYYGVPWLTTPLHRGSIWGPGSPFCICGANRVCTMIGIFVMFGWCMQNYHVSTASCIAYSHICTKNGDANPILLVGCLFSCLSWHSIQILTAQEDDGRNYHSRGAIHTGPTIIPEAKPRGW